MKRNQFSKEYEKIIRYYNKMHKEGSGDENPENIFDGKSLRFFFSPIKQLIEKTKSESLIDFGCGKAKYYFNKIKVSDKIYNNVIDYWKINNYILYDPGVDKFLEYPNKSADAVICIDVVEHIPEEDVNVFIEELFKLANKFIFVVIACYPARKNLPNGDNVHLSIKKPDEWKEIISKIKINYPYVSPYVICATDRNNYVAVS